MVQKLTWFSTFCMVNTNRRIWTIRLKTSCMNMKAAIQAPLQKLGK
jgi:hypothetical protein